ncbi:MAG: DUF1573 domain-containing protein [Bacteroidales bacterium]|nr:DUF1573 domain-containing protein [Bacteroidales bacterium]
MKQMIILLGMLLFSASIFSQQSETFAAKSFTGPQIKWDKDVHNFGSIEQNKEVKATFSFTNTGDKPVYITNVKPSCGCTGVDYTKKPVAPGTTSKITATYNAKAIGNFHKSVRVYSSINENAKLLYIKGTVKAIQ